MQEAILNSDIGGADHHIGAVRLGAFSPDGTLVLTGSDDITILWVLNDYKRITAYPLLGHKENVTSATFSPDSKLALTGSSDGMLRLWNLDDLNQINSRVLNEKSGLSHTKSIASVAFSPDGKYILTASEDCTERIWY